MARNIVVNYLKMSADKIDSKIKNLQVTPPPNCVFEKSLFQSNHFGCRQNSDQSEIRSNEVRIIKIGQQGPEVLSRKINSAAKPFLWAQKSKNKHTPNHYKIALSHKPPTQQCAACSDLRQIFLK